MLASMQQESLYEETFAPLSISVDESRCAPASTFEESWNLVVSFGDGAGTTVDVEHQQQGMLTPPVGEGMLEIAVGEARQGEEYCCHALRGLNILVRRTIAAS